MALPAEVWGHVASFINLRSSWVACCALNTTVWAGFQAVSKAARERILNHTDPIPDAVMYTELAEKYQSVHKTHKRLADLNRQELRAREKILRVARERRQLVKIAKKLDEKKRHNLPRPPSPKVYEAPCIRCHAPLSYAFRKKNEAPRFSAMCGPCWLLTPTDAHSNVEMLFNA